MSQRISLSPDSTPARSALACLEAHVADARRLCGANTVPAAKYRLSPEYRRRLISQGMLRISPAARTSDFSTYSKLETLPPEHRAMLEAMIACGAPIKEMAAAIRRSYSTTHRFIRQILKDRADATRAAKALQVGQQG